MQAGRCVLSNFNIKKESLHELATLTAEKLGLPDPYVIEKDWFVTKAIAILMSVQDEIFHLVFQGGTALAKAHRFVQRMSEDCDFRLAYKNPDSQRKKDSQRRLLRTFRNNLLSALKDNGFLFDENAVRVRNEGQFISVRAGYEDANSAPSSLKPYLALEFFLGQVKTPTVNRLVTSLIRETLGEKINHPVVPVTCMSIPETAAEKWVALTRRIATSQQRQGYYDQSLVRHIYDLAMINRHHPLKETEFANLARQVIEIDRVQFKTHSDSYSQDPWTAIQFSLDELQKNPRWSQNWDIFMETMVYGEKPEYSDALKNLVEILELVMN